jgi:hypothetical protein
VWFLKKWCAGCGVGDGVPWGVVFAAVSSGAQLAVRGGAQLAVRGGAQLAVRGGVWMVCKQRAKVPFKRVYLHHYLVLHACVQCSIVHGSFCCTFGRKHLIGSQTSHELTPVPKLVNCFIREPEHA